MHEHIVVKSLQQKRYAERLTSVACWSLGMLALAGGRLSGAQARGLRME